MRTVLCVLVFLLAGSFAASAVPISCFVVHADPTRVDAAAFQSLTDLVGLADSYHVPLTVLLTPQWAELILGDPEKLAAVAGFLARGHEVGAHHHAYWATLDRGSSWDGYTNARLEDLRAEDRARLRGTMTDFWGVLSALPGTRETGCLGLGEEDEADWICELSYETSGHALSDAVSTPQAVAHGECQALEIHHALLVEPAPGELTAAYAAADEASVFAVVAHVSDFAERPGVVERWFQSLAAQDPDGAHRMTVAGAVQAWMNR